MMQRISNYMPTSWWGSQWRWEFRGRSKLYREVSLELDLKWWVGIEEVEGRERHFQFLTVPDSDGVLWPSPPRTSDPRHPSNLSSSSWCKVKSERDSNSFQILFACPLISSPCSHFMGLHISVRNSASVSIPVPMIQWQIGTPWSVYGPFGSHSLGFSISESFKWGTVSTTWSSWTSIRLG